MNNNKNMAERIRTCKYCGSDINIKPSIHNWKNLFRKPKFEDYITFFLIIMIIVSSYAYKSDLNTIIDYYENESYCNTLKYIQTPDNLINPFINISNLSIENG